MSVTIQFRRGSGVPGVTLADGEPAWDHTGHKLYVGNASGGNTPVGGVADGTYGQVTVSSSGTVWTVNTAFPSGDFSWNSHKITGLADPTSAQDAATKAYVDNLSTGLAWKQAVRAATAAAGTLASSFANGSVVDGVTLATGDRLLIKNQSTGSENGLYTVAASGSPTRATDADSGAELVSATVMVREGTVNGDSQWTCTNDSITLGTTAVVFAQISGAGTYTATAPVTLTGNVFALSGPANVTTLTGHGVLVGAGTGAVVATAVGATNTVLHGNTGADPSFSAVVEADVSLSDVTTNNVSTARHGYAPKAPNDGTKFLDGTGAYSVPPGTFSITGLTAADPALADEEAAYSAASAANRKATRDKVLGLLRLAPGFRLSHDPDNPVAPAGGSGSSIYYSPCVHDCLCLFDGTRWVWAQLPQFGVALGTLTNGTNYDFFAFTSAATPNSTNTGTDVVAFAAATGWQTGAVVYPAATGGGLTAGTAYYYRAASSTTGSFYDTLAHALAGGATGLINLTANVTQALTAYSLELLAWSNDTARATAVSVQDGRYCKGGDKTRLYLGTGRTTTTTVMTDSESQRLLWNMYNRRKRSLLRVESANTWTYGTSNYRYWNNSSSNRVEFLLGLLEDSVRVDFAGVVVVATGACTVACILDGGSAPTGSVASTYGTTAGTSLLASHFDGLPGLPGWHYVGAYEWATATVTFYGQDSSAGDQYIQGGLTGHCWA